MHKGGGVGMERRLDGRGGRDGEGVMGVGLMFAMPDCFSYGREGG